jgi:hypothetical protein
VNPAMMATRIYVQTGPSTILVIIGLVLAVAAVVFLRAPNMLVAYLTPLAVICVTFALLLGLF